MCFACSLIVFVAPLSVTNAKFSLLKLLIYELILIVYIYALVGLECLRPGIEPLRAIGTL